MLFLSNVKISNVPEKGSIINSPKKGLIINSIIKLLEIIKENETRNIDGYIKLVLLFFFK